MSSKGINWKGVLFYAAILTILILVVVYFFVPQVHSFINGLLSKISLPKLDLTSITNLFKDNWATILGVGATAIPLLYTTVKGYMDKQKIKKELENAKELAELEKVKADAKLAELTQEVTGYKNDTTAKTLQDKLHEVTGEKDVLTQQIQKLTAQNEQLAKQPSQMLQQIWQASGGQVQEIAGEKVKVLSLEKIQIK